MIFITVFFCHLSFFWALSCRNLALSKAYPVMHAKIKKKIRFSVRSKSTWLGEIKVQHVLPNKFAQAIGPFVFLEHILSYKQPWDGLHKELAGKRSMPKRGIATLTYILAGEVEHLDSIGNHVKLSSGGVHCTKAGKGIVHDEAVHTLGSGARSLAR